MLWLRATNGGTQLQIAAPPIATEIRTGDSVAVNGCCLTVTAIRRTAHVRSPRGNARPHESENIAPREPGQSRTRSCSRTVASAGISSRATSTPPRASSLRGDGADHRLEVELPAEFAHYVAFKGSVAFNGISLTVAEFAGSFVVWIIPHHATLDKPREPPGWRSSMSSSISWRSMSSECSAERAAAIERIPAPMSRARHFYTIY